MFHSSKSRRFFSLILIIALLSLIYGANFPLVSGSYLVLVNPFESKAYQYKMQPHVHSTESDGEYSPAQVVTMMRDVGYDIVALTDHLTVTPDPMVPDVVFVSGEETHYTVPEPALIVLGVSMPVTGSTLQEKIDNSNEQGGVSFLDSPNADTWGWTYEEISSVNNYTGIEIFNSCYAHVQEEKNAFAEDKVDYALSNGRRILLSGGADYHGTWGESLMGGYIVLNTDITTLTQTDVIDIMKSGNYYVAGRINTTDPDPPSILDLTTNGENITILVDKPSTIGFITEHGTISQINTNVTQATYRASVADMYVRVKVTYTNGSGESYAWSNPIHVESPFLKTTNASVGGDSSIVSASYSLSNFGGSVTDFGTGSVVTDGIKARALINWNLDSIPMGSTIVSARMSLYCYKDEFGIDTMTIYAYPLLKPWIEGTQNRTDRNLDNPPSSCWIEYGNNIPWDSEGADAPTDRSFTITSSSTNSGTGWYTFDITEAVQNWFSGSWENNGLILISSNEEVNDLKYFTSSESSITTQRPKLVIWYEDTSPPQYFDSSTNSTWAGASVEFRLRWTDNVGLSGYIFSLDNGVGTFANDTWVQWPISSKEDWSNVTEVVNSAIGKTIRWKVYANDTSDNWNTSPIYSFVTRGRYEVIIFDFSFHPQGLSITRGDTVAWTNNDPEIYTLSFVFEENQSTYLLSDPILPGASWSHEFANPTKLRYYCLERPWITGNLRIVTILGDINWNNIVDIHDLHTLGKVYQTTPQSPNWNEDADINFDNVVNGTDLAKLSNNYGKADP